MPQLREAKGCPFSGEDKSITTVDAMPELPDKQLQSEFDEILRRAEAGEEFTITVSGRPVAELVPLRKRQWVDSSVLEELSKLPADRESLARDLEEFDIELRDPWAEQWKRFSTPLS